ISNFKPSADARRRVVRRLTTRLRAARSRTVEWKIHVPDIFRGVQMPAEVGFFRFDQNVFPQDNAGCQIDLPELALSIGRDEHPIRPNHIEMSGRRGEKTAWQRNRWGGKYSMRQPRFQIDLHQLRP